MKIDKHNYEAYFLDYTEGNLSDADKQELFLFLEQNPDLKKELEEYEAIALHIPDSVFEGKEYLKKLIYTDDSLVAYLENDLEKKERFEIEKAAAENTYLKKEIDLYKKTILIPDADIIYANKEKLKKRGLVIFWNNPINYFRAAAAILLLTGLIVLITKQLNKESESVLVKNKEVTLPENKTVPNNGSPAPTLYPQSNLIAIKEQQTAAANSSAKKQEPLNKLVNTNKTTLIANDSLEKNNTQKNKLAQNNTKQDTLNNQPFFAAQENSDQSYFNHSLDADENATGLQAKTITSAQSKKPFFKFLSFAAKGAKQLGAKHIDIKEGVNENVITMGGLALSETTSN